MAKQAREDQETPTIKERAITYMRRREGERVTTGELASSLGIRRDQATSALHNLAKRSLPESVSRIGDGVWVYTAPRGESAPTPPPAMAELGTAPTISLVGRLASDRDVIIAIDGDGMFYEVRQLTT